MYKINSKLSRGDGKTTNKYFVSIEKMKVRYINPLVNTDK